MLNRCMQRLALLSRHTSKCDDQTVQLERDAARRPLVKGAPETCVGPACGRRHIDG